MSEVKIISYPRFLDRDALIKVECEDKIPLAVIGDDYNYESKWVDMVQNYTSGIFSNRKPSN